MASATVDGHEDLCIGWRMFDGIIEHYEIVCQLSNRQNGAVDPELYPHVRGVSTIADFIWSHA